jgi:hypothetical protein
VRTLAVAIALVVGLTACGGDESDGVEDNPDEATFCRLAMLNEPVAEADAPVLRRLDELAPDEVDAAVDVLREAAEELEEFTPGSPELIAHEFEVRFREDYLAARAEVEAFIDAECRPDDTDPSKAKDPNDEPPAP